MCKAVLSIVILINYADAKWIVLETLMKQNIGHVGFEVLTAVVMKSTVFWDITPCSPLKANRRFGGTYRLHLHGRNMLASCFHAGSLLSLFFRP
jgi:hypothetical protein